MTQTEALKLALEALEKHAELGLLAGATITAIKEALAQPELTLDGLTPTEFALRELYEFQEATGCDTAAEFKAQPEQDCNYCGGTGDVSGEYPGVACPECNGSGVRVQPEFIKHEVENAEDWSEWVCPNPQSYLMKCCDCGLVHEAQFKVVQYKSEDEREECDPVDDPNVQAVFRMRRSEEWSPKDTAYRPGGLAQPEQEPHSWYSKQEDEWMTHKIRMEHERLNSYTHKVGKFDLALYTSPPPQRKPLTDEEIDRVTDQQWANNNHKPIYAAHRAYARAIEAAHGIKEKP